MTITFSKNNWESYFFYAKSYRFDEDVKFSQEEDYITNKINHSFPNGFEYINIFTKEKFTYGTTISSTMSFEEYGAPMITFCNHFDIDKFNNYRMNNYFEIVLYENGINIWYLYLDDNVCKWIKLASYNFNVSKIDKHILTVTILKDHLKIGVDDKLFCLKLSEINNLDIPNNVKIFPNDFHIGVGACEQINKIFDITIK